MTAVEASAAPRSTWPRTMKLAPQHRRHFWEKGWVVVEGVFAPDVMERTAELALRHANEKFDPNGNACQVDRSADGKVAMPRKLDTPFLRDMAFRHVIFESALPGLIEQIIGKVPLLAADQIFFKPPHHGSPKAYHQDNQYFLCHPNDQMITAWIAMDDVDAENGCLRYIDGSHLGPILPCAPIPGVEHDLTPPPGLIDRSKESLAPVKKGGVVFHHTDALHSSGANHSSRWRRGYATHWVSAEVRAENNTLETAYFRKPELWAGWGEKFIETWTG